jgi:hypothetical protein
MAIWKARAFSGKVGTGFPQKTRQNKTLEPFHDSVKSETALERRAKKWNPVFRKTGATTKDSTASGDPDLSLDAVRRRGPSLKAGFAARSLFGFRQTGELIRHR